MHFADLHLHTHFSDGTYSPEELVGHAQHYGLKLLSLTDHDTVEGCARMAIACGAAAIEFIPGSEFTAEVRGRELHLLGYFLDTANEKLLAEIAKFQAVRQNRIREMVARLNELGIPLEADVVFAIANCRSPGRPHVGRALVQTGHCATLDEAFERFLKKNRPAWVPKFKMSAVDAIELIHQAGGLAVMAHPGLNNSDDLIYQLAEAKLDGLECFHSKHSNATSEHYLKIAAELKLVVTGGSDCHGMNKGKPLIGSIKLPEIFVERMKRRLVERIGQSGLLFASKPTPPAHSPS
ncbi:MAG: PHP domain-containing protein [Verrucomicrobia bacterium]|nr:PHP domain-containing protein [Verrucomicrobiota bacterium]